MPSLSALEPASLHCECHSFVPMLQLRSTLSRQGAALAHLDSILPYDLVLWTDRSVPFPFGNGGSGVLANCSLCGTEATLFFRQTQYAQVFLLKSAPLSKLFAGLGSINKSATFFLFSSYLILVLSSSSCSLLSLSCYLNLSGRNCLLSSPVLSGYNGSLDTFFFRKTAQLMSWPEGSATHVLCNSLLSFSYLLYPLIIFL